MRQLLRKKGLRWFPSIGWAERGGGQAGGHGNSVPRFHLTWGTGVGVVDPFIFEVKELISRGKIQAKFRYCAKNLIMSDGEVKGISGDILADDEASSSAKISPDIPLTSPSLMIKFFAQYLNLACIFPLEINSLTSKIKGSTTPTPVPQVKWKRGTEFPCPPA